MPPDAAEPVSLTQPARLLVETASARAECWLVEATDTALRIRGDSGEREMPWTEIRRINRRAGRERPWWIPMVLALVFGGLLGSCGFLLDELNHSTSGHSGTALPSALLIGALVGGLLGMLIMFAMPGPWWEPIYAVPEGAAIAPDEPVATRLAAGAIPTASRQAVADKQYTARLVAWTILTILFLAVIGTCGRLFGR
jgi:hypothetical protein